MPTIGWNREVRLQFEFQFWEVGVSSSLLKGSAGMRCQTMPNTMQLSSDRSPLQLYNPSIALDMSLFNVVFLIILLEVVYIQYPFPCHWWSLVVFQFLFSFLLPVHVAW